MNSARQVDEQIKKMKEDGWCSRDIVWWTARLCEGWPYVFGAWGAYCTPAERKKRYKSGHPTIYSKCQVLREKNPKSSCDGCQWFPNGERVRCYDCRGFTDWCLLQVGIDLIGEGATSQWNHDENWAMKGLVKDGIPKDTLVCLFYPDSKNPRKMAHTGFGLNGETVECSNGVEYHEKMASKWTHWAIPEGIECGIDDPAYIERPDTVFRLTIRKGNKGEDVKHIQTILYNLGYNLGSYGIDGDFGSATEAAVKEFQRDNGLNADGVVGPLTYEALEKANQKPESVEKYYTVCIHHLDKTQAEALRNNYPGATVTEE